MEISKFLYNYLYMTIYQFFFIVILVYLVYNIKNEYNLMDVINKDCI